MVPEDKRDVLHRGLSWLGFGRMAAGVYAMPSNNRPPLDELLADLEIKDSIVRMQAQADNVESLQRLVMSRWKLGDLRQRYKEFTSQYRKAEKILRARKPPADHSIFLLRVLLMHEYRRILLQDPELPAAMLPRDWEGYAAQSLTGDLYRELATPTAKWANRELLNADGNLRGGLATLKKRFAK